MNILPKWVLVVLEKILGDAKSKYLNNFELQGYEITHF